MKKLSVCLWFDDQAEAALAFYRSVFPQAKVGRILRYSKAGPGRDASLLTVALEINNTEVILLNGGPHFRFSEAVSLIINCESQQEVDYYWDKLLEGGEPQQCGWLKDKFGVSWQVVPLRLTEMLDDPDPDKSRRVTEAMLPMVKLDLEALQRAYTSIA